MNSSKLKIQKRSKKKLSIRSKLSGTPERPRLTVYRSSKNIYAQVIDDLNGKTICSYSSLDKEQRESKDKKTKKDTADLVGKKVAEKALSEGIKNVVFDRNGYLYHGRIKQLADGAREAGLEF